MTDIRIVGYADLPVVTMDWLLKPNGALDESDELATAIKVALGTDALAQPDDFLPDIDSTDRRGWWADQDAALLWNGWAPIGTRLWLMQREAIRDAGSQQGSTMARIEQYIAEALQPFVDQLIVGRFDITVIRAGTNNIQAYVVAYRGPLPDIAMNFQGLWSEITGQPGR
jgi:phage gp46-like protein